MKVSHPVTRLFHVLHFIRLCEILQYVFERLLSYLHVVRNGSYIRGYTHEIGTKIDFKIEMILLSSEPICSKGIGKKAVMKKIVSIIITCLIGISLVIMSRAETKGPTRAVSIGGAGSISYVSLDEERFSDEVQQILILAGYVCVIYALIDAILLACYKISWTEIYRDRINANYMGKTVTYRITDIIKITEFGNHIFISGSAGSIGIITADPKEVSKILKSLILK